MLIQGLCFALCFFAFQLTEFTINDRVGILFGIHAVNTIYSIGIACTALGFLSFSMLRRMFEREKERKMITCIVGALSLFASVLLLTTNSKAVFLISAFFALLSYGHISGNYYYSAAMAFQGKPHTGKIVGIGMGCAVLLQFVVQNLVLTNAAFIVSVTISVGVLLYYVIKPPRDWMFENPLPFSSENRTDKKEASTMVMATILMTLVIALIDGVVVQKHAEGSLSVSSYTRLFYALSLPVAGFVADIKNRKYMSIVTVSVLFVSTISTALISAPGTYFGATAFMYMYSGFYVMYFTMSFLDFAPKTQNPALWAGMGRVLRSLLTAVSTIPMVWMYEKMGAVALISGSCILSVFVLLVLFPSISKSVFLEEKENDSLAGRKKEPTIQEKIVNYCKYYGFTPREHDVFEKMITTEDGVQEIADSLFVSRRVLQRYISSIYEKTGTKSRIGLFQNFSNFDL